MFSFSADKSTFRVHWAVKRSHYCNGFSFVRRFQSLYKLRSRSSRHTAFCIRSGCSCILPIFIALFRSASPCNRFGNLPTASYLAAALTPFSNAVIGTADAWFFYFPLLRHTVQGIAPLCGFATVASLCPRSSSDAPAPVLHSVCRSTRPTLLG